MVIPRFADRALRNEPLQIFRTGKQRRCFAYVGDAVECVITLMNTSKAAGARRSSFRMRKPAAVHSTTCSAACRVWTASKPRSDMNRRPA